MTLVCGLPFTTSVFRQPEWSFIGDPAFPLFGSVEPVLVELEVEQAAAHFEDVRDLVPVRPDLVEVGDRLLPHLAIG